MDSNPVLLDIAHLLEAGIAPADAVARLEAGDSRTRSLLTGLQADLKRGRSLAESLHRAGLANTLETEIVRAAEAAGKTDEALRLVSRRLEQRRSRAAALRTRLWLPNTLLFIGLTINVVRAVTAGASLSNAATDALGIALLIVIVTQSMLVAVRADIARALGIGWRLGLRARSTLFRHYFEQTFYTLFVWQADAGMDYAAGARNLRKLINATGYRKALDNYQRLVRAGKPATQALRDAGLLVDGELAETINVGEQSGRLVSALQHYLLGQGMRLEQSTDSIFKWLPRIYYFVVLLVCAWSLV
jgi:type II secretory pathway component PulF